MPSISEHTIPVLAQFPNAQRSIIQSPKWASKRNTFDELTQLCVTEFGASIAVGLRCRAVSVSYA